MLRASVRGLGVAASAVLATASANAQQYSNDFSSGPGNAQLFGTAVVNSGSLMLVPNAFSQAGAMVLGVDAESVDGFAVSFDFRFSNSGYNFPANGTSLHLGVVPNGQPTVPGNGIVVTLDLFQMSGPIVIDGAIHAYSNGVEIAAVPGAINIWGDMFRTIPVMVIMDPAGNLTVYYDGITKVSAIPTGYKPQPGQRFAIAATTGGEAAEQRIDNLIAAPVYRRGSAANLAKIMGDGVFGFAWDTVGSPVEGVASCVPYTNRDVWFGWTALSSGVVTFTTAGLTDDDSVVSVFSNCQPASPGFAEIACDDDSGGNLSSAATFRAVAGQTYLLRLALYGQDNSGASGVEAFRMTTRVDCAGDTNHNGVVSVQDIFDFLAAYFTGCP